MFDLFISLSLVVLEQYNIFQGVVGPLTEFNLIVISFMHLNNE